MAPCNGFTETSIVNSWLTLVLSISIGVYSFIIWVFYQRKDPYKFDALEVQSKAKQTKKKKIKQKNKSNKQACNKSAKRALKILRVQPLFNNKNKN
jgi:hypothetical protein